MAEIHMGGHGLYGTVSDCMKFIRMWLNDGMGPNGHVLEDRDGGDGRGRRPPWREEDRHVAGGDPSLSNDAEFFPGLLKSWS